MAYFLCKNRAQALQSFLAEYWLLIGPFCLAAHWLPLLPTLLPVAEILHRRDNTTILPFMTNYPFKSYIFFFELIVLLSRMGLDLNALMLCQRLKYSYIEWL
jgi:hypothetical protein